MAPDADLARSNIAEQVGRSRVKGVVQEGVTLLGVHGAPDQGGGGRARG